MRISISGGFIGYGDELAEPVDAPNERPAEPVWALEMDRECGVHRGLASSAHR